MEDGEDSEDGEEGSQACRVRWDAACCYQPLNGRFYGEEKRRKTEPQ